MTKTRMLARRLLALCLVPLGVWANPIPFPPPASMPLEHMSIAIGADRHVQFNGQFTFNGIPDTVARMQFPLPPGGVSNLRVSQDGVPLPWRVGAGGYPTVLPEYPTLPLFEWSGPFPADGAVFTVGYEHDLFRRGSDWIFFYSLGTGKYFPSYDKVTTAVFEIDLPDTATLLSILLDSVPVDPAAYRLSGSRLDMTLTSEFGPFTRDLILVLQMPEPGSLALLGVALIGWLGVRLGGRRAGA